MKKPIVIALSALVVLAMAAYAFQAEIVTQLVQRTAARRLGSDPIRDLPDGLHLGLCGAGSPFPDDKRLGPCTLVLAGTKLLVFDAGSGASRNIGKMDFSQGRIDAIFLTHYHSDHIDGLGELLLNRWVAASNKTPVPVYGPPGIEAVVSGLAQAYRLDQGYRVAHHGEAAMPGSGAGGKAIAFTFNGQDRMTVLKEGDLQVDAFTVNHSPIDPAVGYRISYKGRSMVISGDTRKSAAVQREATGVDVLVHEALSAPLVGLLKNAAVTAGRANLAKIFDDILNYHTSPQEAAETARDAQAKFLLLNHIAPPLPFAALEKVFLGNAADIFSGPVQVGQDGDFISLPAASSAIKVSRRF